MAMLEMSNGAHLTLAVYPREVVEQILQNKAAAVIFAHNHPISNSNL